MHKAGLAGTDRNFNREAARRGMEREEHRKKEAELRIADFKDEVLRRTFDSLGDAVQSKGALPKNIQDRHSIDLKTLAAKTWGEKLRTFFNAVTLGIRSRPEVDFAEFTTEDVEGHASYRAFKGACNNIGVTVSISTVEAGFMDTFEDSLDEQSIDDPFGNNGLGFLDFVSSPKQNERWYNMFPYYIRPRISLRVNKRLTHG